jgi:hypothetical protein
MSKFEMIVEVPQTCNAIRCDAPGCSKYETNASNALRRFYHHWIKLSGYGIDELWDELDFCSYQCVQNWLTENRARVDVVEVEMRAS